MARLGRATEKDYLERWRAYRENFHRATPRGPA